METKVSTHRGVNVLSISGEIDMYSSPQLRDELMGLIHRKVPVLFVDFANVSYIDSSGIATFVEGLKGIISYGGTLKFIGISKKIMEIFTFTKLGKVFKIYESFDDALHSA